MGSSVWTESNDTEPDYGTWEFTLSGVLEEERKRNPPQFPPDIWPRWADGVPTLLRHSGWYEGFTKNGVTYRSRPITHTISLEWRKPRNLSSLADNHHHLPGLWTSEWSGVYRVFVEGQQIDRLLGQDPTGTLYLGMAGSGDRKFSILRTRLWIWRTGVTIKSRIACCIISNSRHDSLGIPFSSNGLSYRLGSTNEVKRGRERRAPRAIC